MTQRKDRIQIHVAGKAFSVIGGSFQDMLAAVKQINGRRFVSELKVWQLPGTIEEVQRQLDISGFQLEGGAPVSDSSPASQPPPASSSSDRIRVLIQGHRLAVIGGGFQEMLAVVKNLPGRRFDPDTKIWQIPGELAVIKGMVEAAGFELEGAGNVPPAPVPPMEPPDFLHEGVPPSPPPFEPPDFAEAEDEFPFEPPDWWDDGPPPPVEDSYSPEEPMAVEAELPPDEPKSRGAISAPGGDRIRIRLGEIALVVTGGTFQGMLAVVKNIPGRRFNPDEKVWQIPEDVTLDSVQQAVNAAGYLVLPEE